MRHKTKPAILKLGVAVAICLAYLWPFESRAAALQATTAYLLDTAGLNNNEELFLVGTLQGVVNRDAPRLLLNNIDHHSCSGATNKYVEYLKTQKGFTFIQLKSLNEAVETFAKMKRADGVTPLIKGMVKYPPSYWDKAANKGVDKKYNYAIAANYAAQEDLIAVTSNILACATPMLSGEGVWYEDTQMRRNWAKMFVNFKNDTTTKGLAVTTTTDDEVAGKCGSYASKMVDLDLTVTPKIEIVVSDLSPGGSFSVLIDMASTVNISASQRGTKVPALANLSTPGTHTVDLAATGLFQPTSGRARIMICPMTTKTTVTVKSIRFLDANGKEPKPPRHVPPKDVFASLPMKYDLTVKGDGSGDRKYEDNENDAVRWSLANQRAKADRRTCSCFAMEAFFLANMDIGIARKSFMLTHDKQAPYQNPTPHLDTLLSGLQPPGIVFGWISNNEGFSCLKMAKYGAFYGGGPTHNLSFWQWVPLDKPGKPIALPQVRQVKKLENKVYVNYSWASGDMMEMSSSLMRGYWEDPQRGEIPITWGFTPTFAPFGPAMVEYFAKTATPNDSFWCGATGAGYTHPAAMPPALLELFIEDTRKWVYMLGLSPAVDYWDSGDVFTRVYESMARKSPKGYPGMKMFILTRSRAGKSHTSWLDNGVPLVRTDTGLFGNTEASRGKNAITPQSLATAIQAAAAKNPGTDPQFISCNLRASPRLLKAATDLLPKGKYQVVGMPDFIALAEESGGLAVLPYSDGVGSKDQVKMSLKLHNANGTTGDEGTVSWKLPPGWSSTPTNWKHGKVPQGSNLKQIVTFTPPAGMKTGTAAITFQDTPFSWTKQVVLNTYSESRTITDCESTDGWTISDGAVLTMDRSMVKIAPRKILKRHEYWNGIRESNKGKAIYSLGEVNFSRKPILKIHIGDSESNAPWVSLVDASDKSKNIAEGLEVGIASIDLSEKTGWTGVKSVHLHIDPANRYGEFISIRSIKLCYP